MRTLMLHGFSDIINPDFPGEGVDDYAVRTFRGYVYAPDRLRGGNSAEPETDV